MGIKLRKTSKKLNLKSQSKNATKYEKNVKKTQKRQKQQTIDTVERERERERLLQAKKYSKKH